MQKVTVFQEASDRKRNRYMPKKEELPGTKKKFFLIRQLPL